MQRLKYLSNATVTKTNKNEQKCKLILRFRENLQFNSAHLLRC